MLYDTFRFVLLFGLFGFDNNKLGYQLGYGLTKSGHRCRIVEKLNNGDDDAKDRLLRFNDFLDRNTLDRKRPTPTKVQYDCFMDIDTEEYSLSNYTKTEQLAGFSEIFTFKNRNESADCEIYQYGRECSYKGSRNKLHCSGGGACLMKVTVRKDLQFVSFILGVICLSCMLNKVDPMLKAFLRGTRQDY